VPGQRPRGTVYGAPGGHGGHGEMTMAVPTISPLENSGSLTGHILAQGWSDAPASNRRGNTKVVLIMLVVLVAMVALGLVVALAASESITSLFDGLLQG
jgi:hypothetical protein